MKSMMPRGMQERIYLCPKCEVWATEDLVCVKSDCCKGCCLQDCCPEEEDG